MRTGKEQLKMGRDYTSTSGSNLFPAKPARILSKLSARFLIKKRFIPAVLLPQLQKSLRKAFNDIACSHGFLAKRICGKIAGQPVQVNTQDGS